MSLKWTAKADVALAWFWSKGLPTAEMAAQMTRKMHFTITKNMVIGRVHRLKLPPRGSPIKGHTTKDVWAAHKVKPKPNKLAVMNDIIQIHANGPSGDSWKIRLNNGNTHHTQAGARLSEGALLLDDPDSVRSSSHEGSGGKNGGRLGAPLPIPGARTGAARTCQWTECERAPWLFCDAPSVAGYSWCAAHKARVFTSVAGWGQAA